MALARVAYLQGDLVARVGAEHAKAVDQERQVDAKLVVALALEAREQVLLEVDVGLQAIRLLHREAEAVLVDHAVRLLPRTTHRETAGTPAHRTPTPRQVRARRARPAGAGLRTAVRREARTLNRVGRRTRREGGRAGGRAAAAAPRAGRKREGVTNNVPLQVDGGEDVDDALRVVRFCHHRARLAPAAQHCRARLRHALAALLGLPPACLSTKFVCTNFGAWETAAEC